MREGEGASSSEDGRVLRITTTFDDLLAVYRQDEHRSEDWAVIDNLAADDAREALKEAVRRSGRVLRITKPTEEMVEAAYQVLIPLGGDAGLVRSNDVETTQRRRIAMALTAALSCDERESRPEWVGRIVRLVYAGEPVDTYLLRDVVVALTSSFARRVSDERESEARETLREIAEYEPSPPFRAGVVGEMAIYQDIASFAKTRARATLARYQEKEKP